MRRFDVAVQDHLAGGLRFEVHRSALAEAAADAALGMAWVLLWLVFVLALAPPTTALGAEPAISARPPAAEGPGPVWRVGAGSRAQPAPGPSVRGVAPANPGGAG